MCLIKKISKTFKKIKSSSCFAYSKIKIPWRILCLIFHLPIHACRRLYLLYYQRYIELNPVRAGMVDAPGEYVWSSYHSNGFGKQAKLWTPHDLYLALGKTVQARTEAYRALFEAYLEENVLTEI